MAGSEEHVFVESRSEFGKYVVGEHLALSLIKAQISFLRNDLYLEDESSLRVVSCGNLKVLKLLHSRSEKVID